MRRREHGDRGAAAVEFALVVPILLLLVFGIIDYGLYFNNAMGTRDGARAAARQGSVAEFGTGDCAGYGVGPSSDPDLQKLACLALNRTIPVGGVAYARVATSELWEQGEDLRVCVAIVDSSVTGYVPLPDGGNVRATIQMRIEQPSATPKPAGAGVARTDPGAPTAPSGGWGGWCD